MTDRWLTMRITAIASLFAGTLFAASGYGATFLLSAFFKSIGGNDLHTGIVLGAAMAGTFIGVPLVGWFSTRYDPARMSALACCSLATGFAILTHAETLDFSMLLGAGGLIGLGWGMFYAGTPMGLSERVNDDERIRWFSQFGAFQMAGIGGGPVVLNLIISHSELSVRAVLTFVGISCLLAAVLLWTFTLLSPVARGPAALRAWVRPIVAIRRTAAIRPILMVGCGACVFSGLLTFQTTLVTGTEANAATFYAINAITVVVGRLVFGPLTASMAPIPLAAGLLISMTLGIVAMFGVALHPGFQWASAVLIGVGYGLIYSLIQTWVVNDSPVAHRQAALTWFVLSYFVGIFGFPVFGAWVITHFGRGGFLCTLLGAALIELALLLVSRKRSADASSQSIIKIEEGRAL
ncbi:MFS transporter [Pseudomonas sp. RC10]|uniref:MFS transporter n=1 Tax=Pseudomonas bambusae TaxID=3139142 RepID=UPI003138621A